MGQHNNLTDAQRTAWRDFLLAHSRVLARLDADLTAACEMTLAEYEVLLHLSESEDSQLRMNELAELARLSPSGLTRRFDALVRRGWVSRERCSDDRRGVMARLTDEGRARLLAAAPVHERGQNEYFFNVLDDEAVDTLGRLLGKVADLNAPDGAIARI